MISQSNRISQENKSPQPIFKESSLISNSLNDECPSLNHSQNPLDNDYNNNHNQIPIIPLQNPDLNNIDHEDSAGASSTTSHISQSKISNKLYRKEKYLSKKTQRKSSRKTNGKGTKSTISKNDVLVSLFPPEKNDNNPQNIIEVPNVYNVPNYPEKDYLADRANIELNDKHSFMMKHFPMMYKPFSFYKNIKCLNQRRKSHREIFIHSEEMTTSQQVFFLNESSHCCNNITPLPRNVWSVPNIEIIYDDFFHKCNQVWPFNQCCLIKEYALEYLMMNDYNMGFCFENLSDFVSFVKLKSIENNIPLIQNNVKFVKNYSLRKTKKTVYR